MQTKKIMIDLFKDYRWAELIRIINTNNNEVDIPTALSFKSIMFYLLYSDKTEAMRLILDARKIDKNNNILILAENIINGEQISHVNQVLSENSWEESWCRIYKSAKNGNFAMVRKLLENIDPSDCNYQFVSCLIGIGKTRFDSSNILLDFLQRSEFESPFAKLLIARLSLKNQGNAYHFSHDVNYEIINKMPHGVRLMANYFWDQGKIDESLIYFDRSAKLLALDLEDVDLWLALAISHPKSLDSSIDRIKFASSIMPDTKCIQGRIASYALIYSLLKSNYQMAGALIRQHKDFLSVAADVAIKNHKAFFKYIYNLCVFGQKYSDHYEGQYNRNIYAIGDSHALSPANLIFQINSEKNRCISRLMIGIKMHHFSLKNDPRRACFIETIKSIPPKNKLIICIGEIDCRPDEGIWIYAKKNNIDVLNAARFTINQYINQLSLDLDFMDFESVIIQGVPAPCYIPPKIRGSDRKEFLNMFRFVNEELKSAALRKGFMFFDVYEATVTTKGFSNGLFHIDQVHLKPKIYLNFDNHLSRPETRDFNK